MTNIFVKNFLSIKKQKEIYIGLDEQENELHNIRYIHTADNDRSIYINVIRVHMCVLYRIFGSLLSKVGKISVMTEKLKVIFFVAHFNVKFIISIYM